MELAGKVIAVLEPRGGVSKNGNEWKVQEYVIETHDQYPRRMCFDVFGADKIQQFNIQVGEELNVFFDIDAREWQGRWFNSIRAWKVERVNADAQQMPPMDAPFPPLRQLRWTSRLQTKRTICLSDQTVVTCLYSRQTEDKKRLRRFHQNAEVFLFKRRNVF